MDYTTIYIYYYYDSSIIFYIDDESDELKSIDKLKSNWAKNKYHSFRMFENYEGLYAVIRNHIFLKMKLKILILHI